jgi:hypothetical protein
MPTSPLSPPTLLRDFWRGLTTPDAAVPRIAAVLVLAALAGLSVAAENFRRRIESGAVAPQSMRDDLCRASVVAMRGAAREADPTAPNFVFVGPSAMRCWLPPDDEVDEVATDAAGRPVRVILMCSPLQGWASSAALIDRFGADFDGWFVVGVTRQLIACGRSDAIAARRRRETQELGFDSDVQRAASAILGDEQHPETGWELWDRRRFYYRALVRPTFSPLWGLRRLRKGKPPAGGRFEPEMDAIGPLDLERLDRHLAVMQEVVQRVRGHGRARIALVETPWEEHLLSSLQSPEWLRDEVAYRRRMREWSEKNDVPWITAAADFQATSADFGDSRHVGSLRLRCQFLEAVVHELSPR